MKAMSLFVILLLAPSLALAQSRCPASNMNCTVDNAPQKMQERAQQGAQRILTNPNPVAKAAEAGRTVGDCMKCGTQALSSGLHDFSSSLQSH